MNAFAFAIILSASAVLSSPVPKNPTDIDTEVDKYFDEWKKYFPEIKIPRPQFNIRVVKDPFALEDPTDGFDDSNPLGPQQPLIPSGFSEDFFKNIREKFFPKNVTNNTVENTREVDGHVIHEKESTYSNGDENSHVVFKHKTVIIRPKDAGSVDKKFGTDDKTLKTNPKPSEYVPRYTTASSASASVSTFNKNNPDEDVEMVQRPQKGSYNEAIQEGNSIDNNFYVVDLSKDTRVNDLFRGPMEPKAEVFDVKAKRRQNRRKENPNAPITALSSNDLDDDKALPDLEHDTDVNTKTKNLKTEEDAETFDTNAIRKKRKNSYPHHT